MGTVRIPALRVWGALFGLLMLAGCGQEKVAKLPPPHELTREANGYFCQMIVADHLGPKGQIFVDGQAEPIWFPSVRDTIAFMMLPGETKDITAVYVNDMAKATNWDHPEPDTWIEAGKAYYVIGSELIGGMGAAEAVPFSDEDAARRFIAEHGGRIVRLDDMPVDYILGSAEEEATAPPGAHSNGKDGGHS